jgi:large subunit ribosomal protein L9
VEVILLTDVEKVGLRGEVVSVARGYARNFLLPRRLAEEATPARVAEARKVEERRARHEAKTFEDAQAVVERLGRLELRFDVKAGPTGSLFGSVTPTDIADQLWEKHRVRVDRRKIGIETLKRIGRYQVPIELFQDVTAEVRTLVVPEGGELPPEEELAEMEAAERAEREQAEGPKEEAEAEPESGLDLDALDAAAAAQDAEVSAEEELEPSPAEAEAEVADDEFDRAVDADPAEHAEPT